LGCALTVNTRARKILIDRIFVATLFMGYFLSK
jgi:hypothetical protein